MKTNPKNRMTIRFEPDEQFEVKPDADIRARLRTEFSALQNRLVHQLLHQGANTIMRQRLDLVAAEAAAVAWTTPYPLLVMPLLFEEKAQTTEARDVRQKRIKRRSRSLIELAGATDA